MNICTYTTTKKLLNANHIFVVLFIRLKKKKKPGGVESYYSRTKKETVIGEGKEKAGVGGLGDSNPNQMSGDTRV